MRSGDLIGLTCAQLARTGTVIFSLPQLPVRILANLGMVVERTFDDAVDWEAASPKSSALPPAH